MRPPNEGKQSKGTPAAKRGAKGVAKRASKDLVPKNARGIKGGAASKGDGSLDAGLHFKYDIKGNKEG